MQFPSSNLLPGMAQERAFSKAWGLNPFSVTYGLAILCNLQTFMLNMLCRTTVVLHIINLINYVLFHSFYNFGAIFLCWLMWSFYMFANQSTEMRTVLII